MGKSRGGGCSATRQEARNDLFKGWKHTPPVRLVTWNVRGLNGPVKRSRVFAHLKSLKAGVVFLQETHLRVKGQVRLRKGWVGQVFHSGFDSKSRGVAILMGKRTGFVLAKEVRDPGGDM